MPGNEVEDGIRNLVEPDNSSQGQHLSHGVDGSWSALNDNYWVGKQRQSVVPLNFNLQNYSVQQLDSVRGLGGESASVQYKPNYSKLTPSPENYRSHSRNYQLNTNGSLLGNQSFQTMQNQPRVFGECMSYDQHSLTLRALSTVKSQPEYESGTDSPTLTANSERSEITEVSTDFSFLRGQQQLARDHQPGISQPDPMQQSGYSDMQLLQQHMMFKQLQELQRQQQLQQLGDVRQQNSMNQLSAMSKQAAGIQFSPLNGTPINNSAQMFMNWPQFSGASSAGQGVANRLMFSPENGQPLCSVGHVPQPLDGSLYCTPVATARGNTGKYSQLRGIPQAQRPVVQPSSFSNPFVRDQSNVSPDQLSMLQGALISNQGFPGKNMFGDAPNQGLNSGVLSGSFQEGNSPQINASVKEFSGRQEQTGWPVMQQKTTQYSPSLGLVPLDPVEEKILYNMDDTIWDASFGRRPDVGFVGVGNTLETTDLANSFPSIQSGSWSALVQSAVAEASSSDTGLQEEWSGLTFQNTDQSTDNQLSNFIESDNQPTGWVDNSLQSASSFSSKPLHTTNDSSMSSSFPGFQQPGIQFPVEQRRGLHQDGSHESLEKPPNVIGEWIDCNPRQKPSSEASQQVSLMHLNNAWAGQVFEHSEGEAHKQGIDSHRENSQMNFSAVPYTILDHQTTNQQVMESNQSEYLGCADIPVDKEKESMERNSQQIGNGSHVHNNPYGGGCETHEKQNSYFQSKNSNGSYNSKGLSVPEQVFSGHFHFFVNASSNSINLEQGHLPHLRGNSRASEELPSKGDLTSVGSDGSDVAAQASRNMLELLHKVDQSRDDGNILPYGSADCNLSARVPEAEIAISGSQLYNQSSTSQGFGLRLSPPSQRLPSLSHFHTSHGLPQTVPYPNSWQVNSELGEKNQTWLATPSSVQTLPLSHELSQRTHWDDKSNASGQTGTSSFLKKHGKSATEYMADHTNIRNPPQMQFRSGAPVASQSSQATSQPTGIRHPLFNVSVCQDNSPQMCTNHLGRQFPVLEAVPVSQPSVFSDMSQQGDVSARPHNIWTNVPSQRPPTVPEHLKGSSNFPSSKDPSNNSTVNTPKRGYGSSEFGTGSQQQISSEIIDASKHILDAGALPSGYLVAHSHQLDLDRVKNEDNHVHGATGRNMASAGHSLESSSNLHQNYSLLDQVCAIKNVEADPITKSSGVPHDSFPSRDANMMKFLTEDDLCVKALSQPALQDRPTNETVQFGQNNSQNQSRINNLVSNLMDHSQVSPLMAPSWWKQFGTLKNGMMLPMYNSKVATGQLALGKPSQNLQILASVKQVDTADAIQGCNIMPNAVATLSGTEHTSAPHVLPTDITSQSVAIMRPKKRKSVTFEPCPWHKEVTEGSQRVQNMSMAEKCWAQVTNRVIEKVEDEVEMAEELQPILRSKRRLILIKQLMQQLFFPLPKSILLADATSHHDSAIYFISRIALGDACNFTCCLRNDLLVYMDNSNMTSQKLKAIEGTDGQQFSEVVDELSARAQKLENDFQRVDKMASVVDTRVECHELERFAVINRFAKFHIRAHADASGTSSSSGPTKPFLQRYVTALPMLRKLPEGLQCVSL